MFCASEDVIETFVACSNVKPDKSHAELIQNNPKQEMLFTCGPTISIRTHRQYLQQRVFIRAAIVRLQGLVVPVCVIAQSEPLVSQPPSNELSQN